MKKLIGLALLASAVAAGNAQSFVNGNFETGDFSGWTITNTTNGTSLTTGVVQYDIDGPGAHPTNFVGRFQVGQVAFQSGVFAGINLTQTMNLSAGVTYTISMLWSNKNTATSGGNANGGRYQLIVDGATIATGGGASISAGVEQYGSLSGNFTPGATQSYTVGVRIERPFIVPTNVWQHVDDFTIVPEPASFAALGLGALALLRRRRK